MEQVPLSAQKRNVLGRKVKSLRKEGLIPAHVFGHKIKTVHIQVKGHDFQKVFEKAGETGIVDLAVDGEKRPVLIRNIQTHPVSDLPLHIDFYQVNLTEKVKVDVPLEVVGEAPAVEKKLGLLLTPVAEVAIEALPADIPEKIEVDISKLENVGDEIKVKDLQIDTSKITLLVDPELVVVQIGELVTKEMEAVEAEIEAEKVTAEVTPEEAVEGAVAEGEPRPEGREAAGAAPREAKVPQEKQPEESKGQKEKPQEEAK